MKTKFSFPVCLRSASTLPLICLVTFVLLHSGCSFDSESWTSKLTESLQGGKWSWAFLFSYILGFLTSLTPCVYPLIPITMSLFGGRAKNQTRLGALKLAAFYVLGISMMYSALGIFSALSGNLFGSSLSKPYVIIPIAIFFLLMAASLLGAFSLQLPSRLQTSLASVGGKGIGGAFLMGLVAGIIAAPCTGPPLLALLTFVSTQHSTILGGTLLFSYALGIGTIFLLIAGFALKLPKSGMWMEAVKNILALILIIAAFYYLRFAFSPLYHYGQKNNLFLGINLTLVALGIFLGGIHLTFQKENLAWLRKTIGIILISIGGFGVLAWVLKPIPLQWLETESAISQAKVEHRPLLIDFRANWCFPCTELETKTFSDLDVQKELSRFTLLKVDATFGNEPLYVKLNPRFQAGTLPAVILINSEGVEVKHIREFISAEKLLPILQQIK